MSTANRLISGSMAAWTRIIIMVITQVVLVPVYLSYWNTETYGIWIAVQSAVIMLTLLDLGHHTYIGYELLRLVHHDKIAFCRSLWSALLVGISVALFELMVIAGLVYFGLVPLLVSGSKVIDVKLASDAGYVLFLGGLNWVVTSAFSGYFVRCLEAFGYHPRLAWWGVMHLVLSSLLPAGAVVLGASVLEASIVLTVGSFLGYIPIYADMFRLMKRERIWFVRPSWKLGIRNFSRSTGVTGKLILENLRQQGVRLILAPISGPIALAAFSTMRTGANVALQGLNSIINPLMPDLMRFLHGRDQIRSEAGFSTIWVVLVAIISPAVIVLQAAAPSLFHLWTNGRIEFDPIVFTMLSMSVLIYALSQPAVAVITGNNLMRPQLLLTGVSAILVTVLVIALVPLLGLPGAGVAVVVSETAAAVGYVFTAKVWLQKSGLQWPRRSFAYAATSVVLSSVSMSAIAQLPDHMWLICAGSLLLCAWNFFAYWKTLPHPIRGRFHEVKSSYLHKARSLVGRLMP